MAGFKKILLAQMAEFRAGFAGDVRMVVDDQPDIRAPRDGQNRFGHAADFVRRRFFSAELDQVRAAVAELLRHEFRRAATQIGRVHERVKPAVCERFHGDILTTKYTKHTKEFRDAGDPFRAERGCLSRSRFGSISQLGKYHHHS